MGSESVSKVRLDSLLVSSDGRTKLNSEILQAYDPEPIYAAMYFNGLGVLDPPLNQNQIICLKECMRVNFHTLKAIEGQIDAQGAITLSWDK